MITRRQHPNVFLALASEPSAATQLYNLLIVVLIVPLTISQDRFDQDNPNQDCPLLNSIPTSSSCLIIDAKG